MRFGNSNSTRTKWNDEIEKGWIENKEFPQNRSEKETNVTSLTETTTYTGNNNEFDKIQHISRHQSVFFVNTHIYILKLLKMF